MNQPYIFVSPDFKTQLQIHVIQSTFESLNPHHKNLLLEKLCDLIDIISVKFNFDISETGRKIYIDQLSQNNFQDAKGLLLLLLPFINDPDNTVKKKISSLDQLYVQKTNSSPNDVLHNEPSYLCTNIQYGRCLRNQSNSSNIEIMFDEEHLEHNFKLLSHTIKLVSNRLYTNWINVIPVSNFKKTLCYAQTKTQFQNKKIKFWDPYRPGSSTKTITSDDGALDAEDLYNITTNYLYYGIKNIKWTIFDFNIGGKLYSYLYILNQLLPIEDCGNGVTWNELDRNAQDTFDHNWKNLVQANAYSTGISNINSEQIAYVVKQLMYSFDKSPISHSVDGYIHIPKKKYDDNESKLSSSQMREHIRNSAIFLKDYPQVIYLFIHSSLERFRTSWYSKYFYQNDRFVVREQNLLPTDGPIPITLKNIYNWAKSFCHITVKDLKLFIPLPQFWQSLSTKTRNTIIERLNWESGKDPTEWFNISAYIEKYLEITDKKNKKIINTQIHDTIRNAYPDIVFEVLTVNGVFTELKPDRTISDEKLLPRDNREKNNKVLSILAKRFNESDEKRNELLDAHYFIHNKKFRQMQVQIKDKHSSKSRRINWVEAIFKQLNDGGDWIHTYAMDWISQIAFYHRFIHNRVIYVTGSTGVGKSSQIPKLLLYALKMIGYKNDGHVICTQPRKPPTIKTARTVSAQMGIPIEQYNASINDKVSTSNYWVQFQHQEKKHKSSVHTGLQLEIVTDGTLVMNLQSNPLLKKPSKDGFRQTNIYDAVLIDEAHEHGANMDLILTLMRHVAYFNNDIKLVIVSATLDSDEPTYRRYYRDINDNKCFPLNIGLETYQLDRINVDRRLHLSPPGVTTQHRIEEYYKPGADPVQIVQEITQNSSEGDILLFMPGEKEIKKAINRLKPNTPPNVLVIPYFSKLSDEKRKLVEDIDRELYKFPYPKDVDFSSNFDTEKIKKVSPGTYKRVIIVATNIAEASITINSLKFVVETGTEKINRFNFQQNNDVIMETDISESSRIQRKGRVGRVQSGTVYYTYPRGKMVSNKIKFKISIQDIKLSILQLLNKEGDTPYFTKRNDPNIVSNLQLSDLANLYGSGIDRIIDTQYFAEKKFFSYVGNMKHYDYQNRNVPKHYLTNGFSSGTLMDFDGSFYIIHPDELLFERNIYGEIIRLVDNDASTKVKLNGKNIVSYKMLYFFSYLEKFGVVKKQNDAYYKTQRGITLMELLSKFVNWSLESAMSYAYSWAYNCSDSMLKLLCMHQIINSANDLIMSPAANNIRGLKLHSDASGDTNSILTIIELVIHMYARIMGPIPISEHLTLNTNIVKNMALTKQQFTEGLKTGNYTLDGDTVNRMLELYYNQKFSIGQDITEDEMINLGVSNIIVSEYINQIDTEQNHKAMSQWCTIHQLNYDKIREFYKKYIWYLYDIKQMLNQKQTPDEISLFDKFTQLPRAFYSNVPIQNIIGCLIHGHPYNLAKLLMIIKNKYYYVSLLNPNIGDIMILDTVNIIQNKTTISNINTFLKKHNMDIILYIKRSSKNTISLVDFMPESFVRQLLSTIPIDRIKYNNNFQKEIIQQFMKTQYESQPKIYMSVLNHYPRTIQEISRITS